MSIPILHLGLFVVGSIRAVVPIVPNAAVLLVTIDIMTTVQPTIQKQIFIIRVVHLYSPYIAFLGECEGIIAYPYRQYVILDIRGYPYSQHDMITTISLVLISDANIAQ